MRLDVEAPQKCQCPAACAKPMETALSLGDDTHAVADGARVGTRARTTHLVWSLYVGGLQAWPINRVLEQGRGQT